MSSFTVARLVSMVRQSTPTAAVTSTDSQWISEEKTVRSHPCPILAFQVWTDKFQVSLRCFSLDAVQISPRFPSRGLLDGPRVEDVDPVRKAGRERQLIVRMPAVKFEKAEGKKRAR